MKPTRATLPADGRDISDHFGLDASFEIRKRPKPAADDEPKPAARKSNAKLEAELDDLAADPGGVIAK